MIERYSLPEMRSLWTEKRKLEIWLEIETLACEAMAELGTIPKEDAAEALMRYRPRTAISSTSNTSVVLPGIGPTPAAP